VTLLRGALKGPRRRSAAVAAAAADGEFVVPSLTSIVHGPLPELLPASTTIVGTCSFASVVEKRERRVRLAGDAKILPILRDRAQLGLTRAWSSAASTSPRDRGDIRFQTHLDG